MSSKSRNHKKPDVKKEKLSRLIKSETDDCENERELSYYINDKVKLMKEVLKIIKPRKIRSMAPVSIKNMDNEEINSMLLEELLGISNKRLKYIFNGQNLDEDSSTDPEDEANPCDVISLDDISDDDFVIDLDSDKETKTKRCRKHRSTIKVEPKRIKKEKHADNHNRNKNSKVNEANEENLMSVLELLELQARARAIRSQLALETQKKAEEMQKRQDSFDNVISDDEAVIVASPKNEEIVITSSSDSENEGSQGSKRNENGSSVNNGAGDEELSSNHINDSANKTNSRNESSKNNNNINNDRIDQNISDKKCDTAQRTSTGSGISTVSLPESEQAMADMPDESLNNKKRSHRKCRHKLRKRELAKADEAKGIDNVEGDENKSRSQENENSESGSTDPSGREKTSHDEGDAIVLNVEDSEMECINLE